jgi:hypothetical protein
MSILDSKQEQHAIISVMMTKSAPPKIAHTNSMPSISFALPTLAVNLEPQSKNM